MPLRRMTVLLVSLLLLAGCSGQPPRSEQPGAATPPANTTPAPAQQQPSTQTPAQTPPQTPAQTTAPQTPADPEQAVRALGQQVLTALQQKSPSQLAPLVHPTKGVRFSPYSYVRTGQNGDLLFTPSQLTAINPATVYVWGAYDGSGAPIELTYGDYMTKFAYRKDYLNAPQVSFNQIIKKGNTLVNIAEAYPNGLFMEYHFPGTQANAEMDWSSVRLVFEKEGNQWYLVGVITDQWTT